MKKKILLAIPVLLIFALVLFGQTGNLIRLFDTNFTDVMTLKWNENDTSNRILNFTINGADRTFALHGNLTVESASLINQDLTTDATAVQFASLGIGTATVPHGGVGIAKFAIEGPNASTAGPHLQFTTDTDDYPLMQIKPYTHDNVGIFFDAYWDGSERSSDAGSNYRFLKAGDMFYLQYDSGIDQGAVVAWHDGIILETSGIVSMPAVYGHDMDGETYRNLLINNSGELGYDATPAPLPSAMMAYIELLEARIEQLEALILGKDK